ncbi:MAG: hypothetical protein ACPF83_12475, partial [Flavobacteriales bacterium]
MSNESLPKSPTKPNKLIEGDDLRPLIKFIGKNWLLLVLLPAIGFVVGWMLSYRQGEVYAARTEILLKSNETYDYQNRIYSNLGYYGLMQDVTNQQRVLASYDIIAETVEKLPFNVSHYLVGKLKVTPQEDFRFIRIEADPSTFKRCKGVPFDIKVVDYNTFNVVYELQGKDYNLVCEFGKPVKKANFTFTVYRRPLFTLDSMEEVKQYNYRFKVAGTDELVSRYKRALKIKNIEYTSILRLTVQDEVEKRARVFLDSLASVYTDYTLESQVQVSRKTEDYIDRQLDELEHVMDSLEFQMELFKDQRRILDLTKEQTQYFNNLVELEGRKRALQLKSESLHGLQRYVRSGMDDMSLPPSYGAFDNDPLMEEQIRRIYDERESRSQLLLDATEESTSVRRQDSLITRMQIGLDEYIEKTRVRIGQEVKDIDSQILRMERKLMDIPKSQRDLIGIERKLKVNEALYVFLLEKKVNTVIARAAIIPQTSVIESARSQGIVGPNKARTRYISMGVGFLLAFLIGTIRVVFFDRVDSLRDLKSLTTMPVLGGIPEYKELDEAPIAIQAKPRSNVSEAFRAIRTNLQFVIPEEGD